MNETMATSSKCFEGSRSTYNSNHFLNRVDELVKTFNQNKITSNCFSEDSAYIAQHLESCFKLIQEIRVWPPSGSFLFTELTLVCNCLLVDIARKIQLGAKSARNPEELDHMICQTLKRVLQFAFKKPIAPCITTYMEHTAPETVMRKVLKAVKNPIVRFRLLECLGRLVLLLSLCCLYRRQHAGLEKTRDLLVLLDHLRKLVGPSVLEDTVFHQQGLLICKAESTDSTVDSLCVVDVVKMVMLACQMDVEDDCLKNKQWHWLGTFLYCKELIISECYTDAMKKLEEELSQTLDPEQKSVLLCQFAECYLKQGCPQLALQTYKDALQVFKGHHSALLYLANVYSVMGLHELQLETLNLLVMALTEKCQRNEPQLLTTEIDALVMSVCQVVPHVTLPCAIHLLAKHCSNLHRYKEAAQQYLKLLRLLENEETFASELALDEPLLETDVRELVVEAIESLALAQRNAECISLCDEFYPILSVCDAPSEISASSYPDISGNNTKDDFSFNNSQPCLLSQSRDYDSTDEVMTQVFEHQTSSLLSPSCKQRHQMKSGIGDVENTYLTSGCLPNLCKLSRKRIRTASRDHDTSLNAAADEKDVWWSNTLPVRLLVSKTDALLAVQGFAEDTMACLTKAFKLVMDSQTSIFVNAQKTSDHADQPPFKRCKFMETGDTDATKSKRAASVDRAESSHEFQMSKTWAKSVVNVALRMAKASVERNQFPSALNSCRIVLQLEPHNICARYMRTTIVLEKQSSQKDRTMRQWLNVRGIDCNSSDINLQSILENKQKSRTNHREQSTETKEWWQPSELQLLNLDITCLSKLIQAVQRNHPDNS